YQSNHVTSHSFLSYRADTPRHLHSFPTRRSSDLATHGTAPKYTGKNQANPGAVLLSGVMMLEHMGWTEAAKMVNDAVEATFAERSEEHTSELQSPDHLVCRLLLEKKKKKRKRTRT